MKCDFCDQKATVFLTQLIEGEMKKLCLCEQCASDKGVTDPVGLSLGQGIFDSASLDEVETDEDASGKSCPECGFTMGHLKKVGRLGCPSCYNTFRADITSMLGGMHQGVTHIGKAPEGMLEALKIAEQVKTLKESLQKAIEAEDYEAAARLRDELKEAEVQI